jgi:DNA-binding CsgD family transcriptional regulator
MSSNMDRGHLQGPQLTRYRELSQELRAQRERLATLRAQIRRGIHPLPGSLERLLAIRANELHQALTEASDIIAECLDADKVDVFFRDPERTHLVALGTSTTELGRLQKELGLDRLALARGGRIVKAFLSGEPYMTGCLDRDPEERSDIPELLGVRSAMIVPFESARRRPAVLAVASLKTDAFDHHELPFLQAAGHWIGLVADRIEVPGSAPTESVAIELTREAARLTRRQREIAMLIAHGLSNAQIAHELVLTPGTVANHVAQMLARLNFSSRTQIGVWAVQNLAPLLSTDLSPD